MLPGFSGHLISESFVESRLTAAGSTAVAAADSRAALGSWRRRRDTLGPASSLRAMLDVGAVPLLEILGFDQPASLGLAPRENALIATVCSSAGPQLLVITSWADRLDAHWRLAVTAAAARSARWALIFNGTQLRIVDAERLFTRHHIEFNLDLVLDDERTAAAFRMVALALTNPAADRESLAEFVAASDRHGIGVCKSLRSGVITASTEVLRALVGSARRPRPGTLEDAFDQSLTIVYRILFLLFAEARALVPMWHPIYRDGYSIEALRAAADRSRSDAGLWDALRAIARLAHRGCRAGDLRVTPFNGRLFAPGRTPLADRPHLDDRAARNAVLALTTTPVGRGQGRMPVGYRDLGVEQLGAIYEALLDYTPQIGNASSPSPQWRAQLVPGSGVRKATGTFYTPQAIADHLVQHTLAPLVVNRTPEEILQLRIVDPAMGSGAFLVAACRYLTRAYEAALIRTGGCHPADVGESQRASIRRVIADRCLYGVDLNPMAVQLARLSLWLTTLAEARPLSFLDHRLLAGDSLTGAWLASLTRAPLPVPRRKHDAATLPLFDETTVRSALVDALPTRFALELVPDDTIEQVREKERALADLGSEHRALSAWKRVADLWCAAWFAADADAVPAAAFHDLSASILSGRQSLPAATVTRYLSSADAVSHRRRFFHWELEFPEVFFDHDGTRRERPGFDAVVGNPPWDMLRADQGDAAHRVRAKLDAQAFLRFTRDAGLYRAQSDGHGNRYQLFLERVLDLTRPGGRFGLVLPTGLAIDRGSAELRRQLFSRSNVDTLTGFDNRRGVFPIHRGVGFLLLTASAGSPTDRLSARFGLEGVSELQPTGTEHTAITLAPALLHRISGEDLTIPILKAPLDLAIVERAAAIFAPLGSDRGWNARFGRELNATDDRSLFRPPGAGLPIVEGKHIEPFRIDTRSATYSILRTDARRRLRRDAWTRPRLAYRDVASATNRLTLIAAVLPADCVSTHTLSCLRTPMASADHYLLCGLFNSFVLNYLVRMRVGVHVTTATIEELPVPTRDQAPAACREIAGLARRLSRGSSTPALACLQARVAHLYQLRAEEFEHVLSTFPLVSREERDRARTAFGVLIP
jgi:hypothetical protein